MRHLAAYGVIRIKVTLRLYLRCFSLVEFMTGDAATGKPTSAVVAPAQNPTRPLVAEAAQSAR